MEEIYTWIAANMDYWVVTLFMAIESSFIPFPSEVVIIPAAYIAINQGTMTIPMIVLAGTVGAIVGALVNYFLALWLGRPIIYKFADTKLSHMLLIDRDGVEKAEKYFADHGFAMKEQNKGLRIARNSIYILLTALIVVLLTLDLCFSGIDYSLKKDFLLPNIALVAIFISIIAIVAYCFSKREGKGFNKLDNHIDQNVKKDRVKQVMTLQKDITNEFTSVDVFIIFFESSSNFFIKNF